MHHKPTTPNIPDAYLDLLAAVADDDQAGRLGLVDRKAKLLVEAGDGHALRPPPAPGQRVQAEISKRDITGTVVLVIVGGEHRLAIVWDGVLSQRGKANFDLLDIDPEDGCTEWSFGGGEVVTPAE